MEVKKKKKSNPFVEGPIEAAFVAKKISAHQSKTTIGAHDIFLGQVRRDEVEDSQVEAIEYTAYEEMATDALYELKERTFAKFPIVCMHIYHSIGVVKAGEICLFVFVSAKHRKTAYDALHYVVEGIKKEAPIFGKEILSNSEHIWKVNKEL